MPRTANNYDTFTAIAEPKRRELLEHLADQELSVGEIVAATGWNQPMVSKHLSVLKESGLVSERKHGRHRIYHINPKQLQPVQLWIKQFEKHWNDQFDHLDNYLSKLATTGKRHE